MHPQRIQRKRVPGWRKPENTIIVDRSSKWGNPFSEKENKKTILVKDRAEAISKYRQYILNSHLLFLLPSLKGKNLACTCKLDEPCHANVLLDMANNS